VIGRLVRAVRRRDAPREPAPASPSGPGSAPPPEPACRPDPARASTPAAAAPPLSAPALLAEINAEVPPGVDWRAGTLGYVAAEFAKHGAGAMGRYLLS
jgi:hypothetical protein